MEVLLLQNSKWCKWKILIFGKVCHRARGCYLQQEDLQFYRVLANTIGT